MAKMPWYPLYAADFTADTVSLSTTEVGALIKLMNYQWVNGSLPFDQARLARIAGVQGEWPEIWATIGHKFVRREGTLLNKRLSTEQERTARRSEAARKSAKIRWDNESKNNGPDADAMRSASLSQSHTHKNKKEGEASPPLPPDLNVEAWEIWLAYRREMKLKKWVSRTIKIQSRKLAQLSHSEQREVIDRSIENGWQGLFPDKGGSNGRRERLGAGERVQKAYDDQEG